MTASRRPISLDPGSTFDEVFVWTSDDDGTAESINGANTRAVMAFYVDPHFPVLTLTSDPDGGILVEPAGEVGTIYVRAEADRTRLIGPNTMYQLVLQDRADPDAVVALAYGPVRFAAGRSALGQL